MEKGLPVHEEEREPEGEDGKDDDQNEFDFAAADCLDSEESALAFDVFREVGEVVLGDG